MLILLFSCLPAIHAADNAITVEEQFLAEQDVRLLDEELRALGRLPAKERLKKELEFGKKLKRLERKIRETKANNRLLYILADWQVTYEPEAALGTIEQLQNSRYSAHKGTLDLVRARYYLKIGDTGKARELADKVTNRIPEFGPIADLVTLYEQVGSDAPKMEGNNLSGGVKDPVSNSKETFLFYYFLELGDDWQLLHFQKFCDELKREEYQGKFRVVCVSFDAKYISALGSWNTLSKDQDWDLFWANPNPKGDSEKWKSTWQVTTFPNAILIGGDRKILDVNPSIKSLQTLSGAEPKSTSSGKGPRNSKKKGPRWR